MTHSIFKEELLELLSKSQTFEENGLLGEKMKYCDINSSMRCNHAWMRERFRNTDSVLRMKNEKIMKLITC